MAGVTQGLAALARTMAATPSDPIPTFEWATVVAGTGEVHVVLDSDDTAAPRPVSDNAAGPVGVGQRVLVVHHGHRLTVISAPAAPVDAPDTGWLPLTTLTGFTAGTGDHAPMYRVRNGVVYWRGRVTRTAGDWPSGLTEIAATPAAAQPEALMYTAAGARGGRYLTMAIDHRLMVASAATSAEVHLEAIPPYLAASA